MLRDHSDRADLAGLHVVLGTAELPPHSTKSRVWDKFRRLQPHALHMTPVYGTILCTIENHFAAGS